SAALVLRLPTTRDAARKILLRHSPHRAAAVPAPEISGPSPKVASGSGTRFTPDRRAAFAGAYNTPTSPRQVGPATMASPLRLVFRRRPWTTCSSPHSATTFHSANKIRSIDPETQKGSCFRAALLRFFNLSPAFVPT